MQTSIWVISLKDASERRIAFQTSASDARIAWQFYDAHRSLQGGLVYDCAATIRSRQRPLRAGELGCYSSHYALWQWLVASDVEQMVVLEDDVLVDWRFVEELVQIEFAKVGIRYLRLFAKVPATWRMVRSWSYFGRIYRLD